MSYQEENKCGNMYVSREETLADCISHCLGRDKTIWEIPDLQRDFVWQPKQILLLLDSLFKGWPFGTLTLLRVDRSQPFQIAYRPMIQVKDKNENHKYCDVPPELDADNLLYLILDGQQRLQSLSFAFGNDEAGFVLPECDWMWSMGACFRKIRNRDYQMCPPGSIFLDLEALASSYAKSDNSLQHMDFVEDKVFVWATSKSDFQSEYYNRGVLQNALRKKEGKNGAETLVRLSKIWKWLADFNDEITEDYAFSRLKNWYLDESISRDALPAFISLSKRLREIRRTPVCRQEISPIASTAEEYSNIIVNIFTRLNRGGEALTPEDITFAWLKRGWNSKVAGGNAKEKFHELQRCCHSNRQMFSTSDLIVIASVVWAIAGRGTIIKNDDLLSPGVLLRLTEWLSNSWIDFFEATNKAVVQLNRHEILFGLQFRSINIVAVWIAVQMLVKNREEQLGSSRERAEYTDKTYGFLDASLERFFIGSQWTGYWTSARLEPLVKKMQATQGDQVNIILDLLNKAMASIAESACKRIDDLQADNRSQVIRYHQYLWVWHRLKPERYQVWQTYMQNNTHVDHSLAFALWLRILDKKASEMLKSEHDEAARFINSLGNCILLSGEFNQSKSDTAFGRFFPYFHNEAELLLQPCVVDPEQHLQDGGTIQDIQAALQKRDLAIRDELKKFITGEPGFVLHGK